MPKKSYWKEPLIVFARMSGWVAFPIVLALFIGKWLDKKFDTAPFIFLSITGIAFIVSIFGILKETKRYLNTIKNTQKITTPSELSDTPPQQGGEIKITKSDGTEPQ